MKRKRFTIIYLAILSILSTNLSAYDYYYPYENAVDAKIYAARRDNVIASLGESSAALIFAADYFDCGGCNFERKFANELFYLTGIAEKKAALLLFPAGLDYGGETRFEALFIVEENPDDVVWHGYSINEEDARRISGVELVFFAKDMLEILSLYAPEIDTLYIDGKRGGSLSYEPAPSENSPKIIENNRELFGSIVFFDRIKTIDEMREIKDESEIAIMKRAAEISMKAHEATIRAAADLDSEYELEGVMEGAFRKLGGDGPAYNSIIGAGINSGFLHYTKNNRPYNDGDLILMDCGARYCGYCADITRTIPASGEFTREQLIIYNLVLQAMDSAFAQCRPGAEFMAPHMKAVEIISDGLLKLGIIEEESEYKRYFPHGTSHYLGLDVHDVGSFGELKPGNVITIEPGVYIPSGSPCDEKWHNIGIRIEDDVLITEDGYENLSRDLPRLPHKIEEMMKSEKK